MRYNYRSGVSKTKNRTKLWWALPVFGLVIGGYVLINTVSPAISMLNGPVDATAKRLTAEKPAFDESRLYVPKLNIDVVVADIDGDEGAALESGAVHRTPESGNPLEGGNFVVAAHRFQLGLTPDQTRKQSPFYHIDQMQIGDQIYVDFQGTRYAYEVSGKKAVDQGATEIEQRTDEHQLTMYSRSPKGPEAGGEVIVAKPIGTIAWVDGAPKLKPRS